MESAVCLFCVVAQPIGRKRIYGPACEKSSFVPAGKEHTNTLRYMAPTFDDRQKRETVNSRKGILPVRCTVGNLNEL